MKLKHMVVILTVLSFVSAAHAIVQGIRVAPGEIPYIAALEVNGVVGCGGTIITDRHVMTAAHCIYFLTNQDTLKVLVGTTDLRRGGVYYEADDTAYSMGFNGSSTEIGPHDIGVILIKGTFAFNYYVNYIRIARGGIPTNVQGQVAGWGRRSSRSTLMSRYLYKLPETILHPDDCQNYHAAPVYDHNFCGGASRGTGTCQGDSGGPFVYNDRVIGVVSWNIPCATGIPDVFTNVIHHTGFLASLVGNLP